MTASVETIASPERSSSTELTAHRRSLDAFTGVRFWAALLVVLFHTHLPALMADKHIVPLAKLFGNGSLAVMLFFMLSGFILAYTYAGQIETRSDCRRFWEARFARIWPMYFVSLLFCTVIIHHTPRLRDILATLFMVQAWCPALFNSTAWNFVCWTLSAEALFYLLFPFLQRWIEVRTSRFQVAFLVAGMFLCAFLNTGQNARYVPWISTSAFVPSALIRVPDFLVGVCLGNVYLKWMAQKDRFPGLNSIAGSGWLTWFGTMFLAVWMLSFINYFTSFAIVGFVALLVGLATEQTMLSRFLSTPLMLVGGQISYSLYLLQVPVRALTQLVSDRMHVESQLFRLLLHLVTLILLSYVCFYAIENPCRRVLRKGFQKLETHRKAIA
jgi:peptidoglycan/LPS O-acetylase OafA/YrhL